MDRTNAITRLNTEEIANEVNNVIKKGLDKLLSDHLCRYELLEKTHDAIMNLPSVRHHLNLSQREPFIKKEDFDTKYGKMIEKLLNRIDELTDEVNQLKQSCKPTHVEVVKLEQKENIKLEIEDAESEIEDQSEEDASEADAESEIEDIIDSEEEYEECDCKVILKEDIIIVDGKNYCGACDPNLEEEAEEAEEAAEEEAEEASSCEAAEEEAEEASSCEAEEAEEEEAEEASSCEAEEEVETEASETEAEEEEEEYIEIDIDDVTYCTNNEENGFIYELTEDGDVGNKIGYLKDGEPFFYADEK
jgi:hypothetical protein